MFSKEQFTTVTPLSKGLALGVLIILPFVAFFLGMNFGKQMIRPIELIVIPRTENVEEADSSDWQTYRNEAYRFEFSYPKDHTAYADINPQEEILIPATPISDYVAVADDESFLFCCEPEVLSISIEPEQTDARDWLDQNLSRYTDEDEIKSIEEVTFAGQNVVEMIAGGNIASTYKLLVIQRGDFLIVINQNSESQFLGEILSTFKFIEPIDTSSWQTYRNEEYGFSFQYPAAWGSVEEDSIEDYWYSPDFTNNPNCGFGAVTASYWPTILAAAPNFGRGGSLYDMQGFSTSSTGSIDFIIFVKEGEPTKRPTQDYEFVEGQDTTGVINENLNYFDTPTIHAVFNTNHEEITAINIFCDLSQENLSIMRRLVSTFSLN